MLSIHLARSARPFQLTMIIESSTLIGRNQPFYSGRENYSICFPDDRYCEFSALPESPGKSPQPTSPYTIGATTEARARSAPATRIRLKESPARFLPQGNS